MNESISGATAEIGARPVAQVVNERQFSVIDRFICGADRALHTLAGKAPSPLRPAPASGMENPVLSDAERKHAAGLMRVNHSGEVCAQALYQGQALTAGLPSVRSEMENAAREEIDHLAWCEERIQALGSHTSLLNPVWYAASFTLGAATGLISDRLSLGFVAATEDQVCKHLEGHLHALPSADNKSRRIVEQMLEDEARHAQNALSAGGLQFPVPIKKLMSLVAKAMTSTSYRI